MHFPCIHVEQISAILYHPPFHMRLMFQLWFFFVSVILFGVEGKRQVNQCNNLVISVTFYYLKIQLLFLHQHLFV